MQYTYWDIFFHCSKQFLNSLILTPFSASAIFCSTSSTSAKMCPFEDFFIWETNKKIAQAPIRWIGKVGHWGYAIFGQKLLNTQRSLGRCPYKSLIKKWANALKESSKNSLKPKAVSHNSTSWYTDTDGFLEHSPRGRSLYYKEPDLQKIIPLGFWVFFYLPSVHVCVCVYTLDMNTHIQAPLY